MSFLEFLKSKLFIKNVNPTTPIEEYTTTNSGRALVWYSIIKNGLKDNVSLYFSSFPCLAKCYQFLLKKKTTTI